MITPNPLIYKDVISAAKSTQTLFLRKFEFYVPFALLLTIAGFLICTDFLLLFITPTLAIITPILSLVMASYLDNNIKPTVSQVVLSTLGFSKGFAVFVSVIVCAFYILVHFSDAIISSVQNSFLMPEALKLSELIHLTGNKFLRWIFILTIVLCWGAMRITNILERSYLTSRHGISASEVEQLAIEWKSQNDISVIAVICLFYYPLLIVSILLPQTALLALAVATTFQYFLLKAFFDGSAKTDAKRSSNSKLLGVKG